MRSEHENTEQVPEGRDVRHGRRGFGPGFGPGPGFHPGHPGHHGRGGEEDGGGHERHGRRGHSRGRGGRGFGGPGGWQQANVPPADDAQDWARGRLPSDWFTGEANVSIDRDEIVITGELPPVEGEQVTPAAAQGRIQRFREESRDTRIQIANEAEARYARKVAWGASIGDTEVLFTHLAVPAMTRLRQEERQVLDTLVDAGVARSRSEALAWCVRLVAEHTDEWLAGLREAMTAVDKLRAEGPEL